MQIERGSRDDVNELIIEEEVSMEEAGAELERERSRENEENRNQIEQEEEWMNEAEGYVEEFKDEEEEGENRQERQDIQAGREKEARIEIGRMTRRTEDEIGEDADTDGDAGTRKIFGMMGEVADDEDKGQDSE
jgi:16S rRNA U516 pseudouridylate synthase RsuA-like enzyme